MLKRFLSLTVIFLIGISAAEPLCGDMPPTGVGSKALVVVGDRSYAPFESQSKDGEAFGIFVDIWRLWSQKTGIPVEYRVMDWADALNAVRSGKADAIGGMSYSAERDKDFDYSDSYYEIQAHIFFHKNIYGLSGLKDLSGFRVGVVTDDYAETFIQQHQPGLELIAFSTYDDLIRAATAGTVRVFVTDTPVALFLLSKYGKDDDFRLSKEPLYSAKFFAAVRGGNSALLEKINVGFRKISAKELKRVEGKWLGRSITAKLPWRWLVTSLLTILGIITLIVIWNRRLRIEVRRATAEIGEKQRELVSANERLRQSEEVFRNFTELSQDCIMRFDRERHHLYVNNKVLELTGIPPEEFIGKTHEQLGFPEHLDRLWHDAIDKVFVDGNPYRIEFELPNGVWIDWLLFPEQTRDGRVNTVMTSARDITSQKRAEAERAAWDEQIRQSQKMEAIGTLASGIAHDFNNLLQTISGCVQLLQNYVDSQPGTTKLFREVDMAVDRASDLVQRLLGFGRDVRPDLVRVDINREILNMVEILERTIPKMIAIATNLDEGLPAISADPTQIQRVLINLATNARDAMPEGGKMTIATTSVMLDEDRRPDYGECKPGEYIQLRFSDTGQGMSQDILAKIFDPFFTTKEVGKGTGLGLFTAYSIVKAHGGHITCFSSLERGTTFEIIFPVDDKDGIFKNAAHDTRIESVIEGGFETILVVDDELPVMEIARDVLQSQGYKVLTATRGEEALNLYQNGEDRIDLVLLDLGMPGMGGQNFLRELLNHDEKAKVIIASGYADKSLAEKLRSMGASAFISKPYRLNTLLQEVRKILDTPANRFTE